MPSLSPASPHHLQRRTIQSLHLQLPSCSCGIILWVCFLHGIWKLATGSSLAQENVASVFYTTGSLCWTLWSTAWEIREVQAAIQKTLRWNTFECKCHYFSGWKWNRNIGERNPQNSYTHEWRTTASQHVWIFSIFPFSFHISCLLCLLAGFEFIFSSFRDSQFSWFSLFVWFFYFCFFCFLFLFLLVLGPLINMYPSWLDIR